MLNKVIMLNFINQSLLLLIQFCVIVTCQPILHLESIPASCVDVTKNPPDHVIQHTNWPFKLSCDGVAPPEIIETSSTQCYYSTKLRSPTSVATPILLPTTTTLLSSYTIMQVVNESLCWRKNITVEVRRLPTRSCFEDVSYYVSRNINVIHLSLEFGKALELNCEPAPNAGYEAIKLPSVPSTEYTTTWRKTLRNRSLDLNARGACDDWARTYRKDIQLNTPRALSATKYRADFHDSGIYSCEASYKGQKAYITHYSVCIRTNLPVNKIPSVLCQKTVSFQEGEEMMLSCSVSVSNELIHPEDLKITWSKQESWNNDICSNLDLSLDSQSQTDSRISCQLKDLINEEIKCFPHLPTDMELKSQQEETKFEIILKLQHMRKTDAGTYSVMVENKGATSKPTTISVIYYPKAEWVMTVKVLIAVLAVLLILAGVSFLVWYYWIKILLFLRRHNGKYDEDGKDYVAILSYYFSDSLPEVTQERTRKIVRYVKEQMEKMNYPFYDCIQNSQPGESSVEALLKKMNESHRMILILTDAYVNERWSRFVAQQGYTNMLKNQTKLIVIRTPGAKSALDGICKKHDDFSSELKEIIAASRNIVWKDNISEKRFKDRVQYALPKLNRGWLADENGLMTKHELVNRGFSVQTQVTDVASSSPDSTRNEKFFDSFYESA